MPDATLGAQLQAQYAALQGCVTLAQQLCSELSTIAAAALAAYEEQDQQVCAASSAQLDMQGLQLDEDLPAGTAQPSSPHHEPQQQASAVQADQAQDTQQQAQLQDSGFLTTPQDSALQEQAAAQDRSLCAGELLFCVQALQQALGQQLELMTKVASAVALDMPAEELRMYATLWELQPYLDAEAMAAALQQLAALMVAA
jgi:hypothetical protein